MHAGIPHPPGTRPPPQQTTTVADGTHPTGMHSCRLRLFLSLEIERLRDHEQKISTEKYTSVMSLVTTNIR